MRKNKVTKVVGISGLTALAIAAPIATVVSCGNSKTDATKEASKKSNVSSTNTELQKAQKAIDNAQKALAKAKQVRTKQAKENTIKAKKEDKKYIDIVKAEIKKAEGFAKKAKLEAIKNIAKQEEELAKAKARRSEFLVKKQTAKANEELAKMNALEIKIAEQKIITTKLSLQITKLKLEEQIQNRKEFKNKTQTLDGITKHISNLETEIQEGTKKIQEANKQLNELNAKQAELKKINTEVNAKKTELTKLNSEVKKYAAEAIKFNIKINAKRTELNSKIVKYTNAQNSLVSKPKKIQDIKDQISKIKIKIQMQKYNTNNGTQVAGMQKAQKALEAELIKQKQELTIAQANNTNAKNDVEKVKKELDTLKLKKDALVNKIALTNKEINVRKTKIQNLSQKIKDITVIINKNSGATTVLKQVATEMLKFEAELNNLKGSKTIMEGQLKALSAYNGTQSHYLKNQEAIIAKLEKEMNALKKPLSTAALTKVKDMISKNKQILIKEEKALKDLGAQKTKLKNHIIDLKKNLLIAGSRTMINHIKDQITSAQAQVQKLFQYALKVKFEQKQRMVEIKARTAQVVAQTQLIVDLEIKINQTTDSKTVIALKTDLVKAKADSKAMLTDLEQQKQKVEWQLSRIKDSKASLTMIEKEIAKAVTKNEILVELINWVKKYEKTLASLLKEKDRLENLVAHVYGPLYPFRVNKNQITMPKQQTRFVYNGHTYKTKAEAIAHLEMDKQVYIINQTDIDSIKETNFYYYKNVAYGNKAAAATAFMGDIKTNVHHYANVPAGTKVDTYAKLEKYLFKAGTAYTVNGKSFHTIDKAIDEYMGSAHIGDGTGKTYAKMLFDGTANAYGGTGAIAGLNKADIAGTGAKNGKHYGHNNEKLIHHAAGQPSTEEFLKEMSEMGGGTSISYTGDKLTPPTVHDRSNDVTRYKNEFKRVIGQFVYFQDHRVSTPIRYNFYISIAPTEKTMPSGKKWKKYNWWLHSTSDDGTTLKYEVEHATTMAQLSTLWGYLKNNTWKFDYWHSGSRQNSTAVTLTFNQLANFHGQFGFDFRPAFAGYRSTDAFNFERKFETAGKWFDTRAHAEAYANAHKVSSRGTKTVALNFAKVSGGYTLGGIKGNSRVDAYNKFMAHEHAANIKANLPVVTGIKATGLKQRMGSFDQLRDIWKKQHESRREYWTFDKRYKRKVIWTGSTDDKWVTHNGEKKNLGLSLVVGKKYRMYVSDVNGSNIYEGTAVNHGGDIFVHFAGATGFVEATKGIWASTWGGGTINHKWDGDYRKVTMIEEITPETGVAKYDTKEAALKALEGTKVEHAKTIWKGSVTHRDHDSTFGIHIGAFRPHEKYKFIYADGTSVTTETTERTGNHYWFAWVGGFNAQYSNHTWMVVEAGGILKIHNNGSVNKTIVEVQNVTPVTHEAPVIWENTLGHDNGDHDYHIVNPAFKEHETYEFVYADGTTTKVKTTRRTGNDPKWFIWVGGFNGHYSGNTWAVMQANNLLRIHNGGSVNKTLVKIRNITLYDSETGAIAPDHAIRGLNKADVAGTGDKSGHTYTKVTASTDASRTRATSKTILGKNKTHAELLAEWNAHHTLTANGKTIAKVEYNANKFTFADGNAKKAVVDRIVTSKIDGTEVMFGTQTGDAKNKVAFSQTEINKIKQELKDKNIVKTVEYGFNKMYFNNKLDALTAAENKAKAEANALYNKNSIKEVSVNMYIELSEYEKYKTLKFFGINGHGSFSKIFVSRGYQYLNTKVPTFTYEVKRQGETTWTKVKFSPTDLSNGDKVRVIKTAINGTIMAPTEFTISGLKATAPSNVRPALTLRTFDAVEIY